VRVHWTGTAVEQLVSIYEYIAQNSKPDADRLIDKLTRRSEQIAAFPQSGRTVPEFRDDSIREVIERPYRIIYRIRADQIDILALVHGAQDL
jgi:toxin ParE1/3/4